MKLQLFIFIACWLCFVVGGYCVCIGRGWGLPCIMSCSLVSSIWLSEHLREFGESSR